MRRILTLLLISSLIPSKLYTQDIKKVFAEAEKQTIFMLQEIEKAKHLQANKDPYLLFPCSLTPDGELKLIPGRDWRSGFFPGVLWYLYEFTGDNSWKEKAKEFTSKVENEKWNAGTHDKCICLCSLQKEQVGESGGKIA